MKDELIQIIKNLKEIRQENSLDISEKTILQESIKIYITEFISINKQGYKKSSYQPPLYKNSVPATDSQIKALKKLKIKFKDNITKQEAWQIIKEIKK